jgi:hypothetical protein
MAGKGRTVMVVVAPITAQLLLPETVYVVVTVGLAMTENPVVALKPVDGFQLYDAAPLAVSVVVPVGQNTVAEVGVTVVLGRGSTVSVKILDTEQPVPPASVNVFVTVYVVKAALAPTCKKGLATFALGENVSAGSLGENDHE